MLVLLVVIGLLTAVLIGGLGAVTLGTIPGAVIAVAILVIVLVAARAGAALARAALLASVVLLVAGMGFGGFSAYRLAGALGDTTGPADAPDAAALQSGRAKLDGAEGQGGFRVELTEPEVQAVLQDAVADSSNSPIKRIDLDVVDGGGSEPGFIDFVATFKGGSLTAKGSVGATLEAGAINIDIRDINIGNLTLPGIARGAVEDLIATVVDLNERLAENQASVQALEIGGEKVLVVGTQGSGNVLTSQDLLGALAENARSVTEAVTPPPERLGPGALNSTESEGQRYYVALGDSLAANVGVTSPREGYVSRFHNQLQMKDNASYGLRNFGISGETSGTLIRGGQLEQALAFMRSHDVAYVTIDIGANDLLGHLGSADCESDVTTPACQERLENTLITYRPNMERIFKDVKGAAKNARVIFLTAYNPFSLGFGKGVRLEAQTDEAGQRLNAVAAEAAAQQGVVLADGFTPMQHTAAATTFMLASPPDIHPNAIGHDILAVALVGALP